MSHRECVNGCMYVSTVTLQEEADFYNQCSIVSVLLGEAFCHSVCAYVCDNLIIRGSTDKANECCPNPA